MDMIYADKLLSPVCARNLHPATDAERMLVFGNLIILCHVGVEIILAVECGMAIYLAAQHKPRHNGELHRLLVHRRKRSRIAKANGANVRIRLAARLEKARAEHLCIRLKLNVRLKTYRIFKFHPQNPVYFFLVLPKMLP